MFRGERASGLRPDRQALHLLLTPPAGSALAPSTSPLVLASGTAISPSRRATVAAAALTCSASRNTWSDMVSRLFPGL